MSKIYAVHFLQADMLPYLGHESKPWKVGEMRSVRGRLALCSCGYHYSPTWAAALRGRYLYGPMACIVEVDDDGPKDKTKGCSRTRTLVEAFNVEREMRLYAADEATRCLKAWEKRSGKVADIRSWAAVKAARSFADGKITDDELSAAWSAARSAARSAAWSAESAAWSAAESAAWSAAESAARAAWSAESAAWSAAESAAWSAAESAAWSARSAAESAAWSAAWSASGKRFAAAMAKATGWYDV